MHAHGREVAGRDDIDKRVVIHVFGKDLALSQKVPAAVAVEGKHIGDSGSLDSRDSADALQHVLQDSAAAGPTASLVVIHLDGGGVSWLEPKINVKNAEEAAQEKSGADKENTGQRYFRNYQQ